MNGEIECYQVHRTWRSGFVDVCVFLTLKEAKECFNSVLMDHHTDPDVVELGRKHCSLKLEILETRS